ncbi:MAG TPA: GNAT family N-acetyltransferase [Jatrophihabitantaceae bacterium]|jgi:RimJ/RimL family protein N-acetyltransferase
MTLAITTDTTALQQLAHAVVAADPVRNTVFGAIAFGAGQDDAAGWAAQPDHDPGLLVARSQPYTAVTFTCGWPLDRLDEVAAALADLDPPPAAVAGPTDTVEYIAAALHCSVTSRMDERLFQLDELDTPIDVPGSARLAETSDAGFLAEWYTAFAIEAFGRLPPGFDARKMVERGVVRSRAWLWLDDRGEPRSFAVRHPAVSGAARIGPVFTPVPFRGHGYGSAATAAATQDILDDGATPCLFTDLSNPTSNRIYQALGYRPVLDRTMLRFD